MLKRYPVVVFEDGDSVHLFNVVWVAPVFFWLEKIWSVRILSAEVNISL